MLECDAPWIGYLLNQAALQIRTMTAATLAPLDIKRLRESNKVSQPVFARYLNTSESTIEKWESGVKKPSGAALKLLAVVQKHGLDVLT